MLVLLLVLNVDLLPESGTTHYHIKMAEEFEAMEELLKEVDRINKKNIGDKSREIYQGAIARLLLWFAAKRPDSLTLDFSVKLQQAHDKRAFVVDWLKKAPRNPPVYFEENGIDQDDLFTFLADMRVKEDKYPSKASYQGIRTAFNHLFVMYEKQQSPEMAAKITLHFKV